MIIQYRYISLIVAVILLIIFLLLRIIADKNITVDNQQSIIQEKNSALQKYLNRYDQEVTRRIAVEASLDQIEVAYRNEIDSIRDRYDIKIRDLQSFIRTRTTSVIRDTLILRDTLIVTEIDTAHGWQFSKRNRYYKVAGIGINGNVQLDIETYDSLTFVLHRKSDGFFRQKHLFIDVMSDNPYTRIENVRGAVINEGRRKRWGVGVHLGVVPRVYLGIGIHYSVLTF